VAVRCMLSISRVGGEVSSVAGRAASRTPERCKRHGLGSRL
jgi:hypothetical protein